MSPSPGTGATVSFSSAKIMLPSSGSSQILTSSASWVVRSTKRELEGVWPHRPHLLAVNPYHKDAPLIAVEYPWL